MTTTSAPWNPRNARGQFRLEVEAAKHYPQSYALYVAQTHRHILLERLLPTLLRIKGVTIMDDPLELWLASYGSDLAKPYRDELFGRLEYMRHNSFLTNVDTLHEVRQRRNSLVHESGFYCDWAVLEEDVNSIEMALLSHSLTRPTPPLTYFAERTALEDSHEVGVLFTRTFKYGVMESRNPALEFSWVQRFMSEDGDQA